MLSVTKERLRQLFEYNIITGEFTRITSGSGWSVGDLAGYVTNQRRVSIKVDGYQILRARLAYIYMLGDIPKEKYIDHINRDTLDDSWANLRLVTLQQNQWNTAKGGHRGINTSKGVYFVKTGSLKKWSGVVTAGGVRYCKYFTTRFEAIVWVYYKRIELHGEYACHG